MSEVLVCLAAGRGTRMGRLSSYLQKCMYPLNGRPFVAYTVDELAKALDERHDPELVFVVGHHREQLMSYFGEKYGGLKISYIIQQTQRGTANAIQLVLKQYPSIRSMIVWLGDSFFPMYAFQQVKRAKHEIIVTAFRDDGVENAKHRLDVHRDGRVLKAWKGTGPYIESGLWRISGGFLDYLQETEDSEYRMLPALEGYIRAGGTVGYVEMAQRLHLEDESSLDDARLTQAMRFFSARKS